LSLSFSLLACFCHAVSNIKPLFLHFISLLAILSAKNQLAQALFNSSRNYNTLKREIKIQWEKLLE
jgi:hypothetical protein